MYAVDKSQPPREWIEQLRHRFPCEKEVDRVLTQKMSRRNGPGYSPLSLETLTRAVESLLRSELKDPFEVSNSKWLSGGASKIQMSFSLTWKQPGVGRTTTPLVLRMEPAESIVETSRLREFQLIKALAGHLPVPPVYWVDTERKHLPYPGLIYGFAEGVTKPTATNSGVTGLGTHYGKRFQALLAPQFVEHLALIHTLDFSRADLSAFDIPGKGTDAVALQLNWWERMWEEDSHEDIPLMRLAMGWMRNNMPPVDRLSIIHGDYRSGNFLFDEKDGRITAWPKDEFFETYEKASGLTVDPKKLRFYEILNTYKAAGIVLATGYRIAKNGKTHQDVLVAWLLGIGYKVMDELRTTLEEVV
jgi:aminoglycoside phosphotransferase (APT) family kinase protein